MSKRRLSNREQLRKMLKETETGSVLSIELIAIQAILAKPLEKAVPALLKLLKSVTQQATKHFIAEALGATKDPRVIRPLLKAAADPQNKNYRSNFIWPLDKYNHDCTAYLPQIVEFLLTRIGFDEATWACIEVIRKMKGPFKPAIARKYIRKLLAEIQLPLNEKDLVATHANRLEAADRIMCGYFNQTARTYWAKWNKGEQPIMDTSKTP